jgi:hypothetical protein
MHTHFLAVADAIRAQLPVRQRQVESWAVVPGVLDDHAAEVATFVRDMSELFERIAAQPHAAESLPWVLLAEHARALYELITD